MSRAVWALAILAMVGFVAFIVRAPSPKEAAALTAEQAEAEGRAKIAAYEAAHPESHLHLTKVRGLKGGFGSVLILSGTLTNDGDRALRDPTITCALTGNSGTTIDHASQKLFEAIPAHGKKSFSKLNMGFIRNQSAQFSCEVTDADLG